MRYRTSRAGTNNLAHFNATPMVDVIFMLTIFFMLVSRFSSAEQIPLEIPSPNDSQAAILKMPERVIINCQLGALGQGGRSSAVYSIGPNQPESLAVIADRLSLMKRETPNIQVVVRADRRLQYADVRALMLVIAQRKIEMLNIAAHVSAGE